MMKLGQPVFHAMSNSVVGYVGMSNHMAVVVRQDASLSLVNPNHLHALATTPDNTEWLGRASYADYRPWDTMLVGEASWVLADIGTATRWLDQGDLILRLPEEGQHETNS